jgi:hypothetical protein
MGRVNSDGGTGFQAVVVRERCPGTPAAPITTRTDLSSGASKGDLHARVVSELACVALAEMHRSLSFDRSRQKRGPPFRQA